MCEKRVNACIFSFGMLEYYSVLKFSLVLGGYYLIQCLGNFELNEVEVGQRVSDLRQLLDVSYPMENGIIRNWDDMELLWNHTFGEGMVILLIIYIKIAL